MPAGPNDPVSSQRWNAPTRAPWPGTPAPGAALPHDPAETRRTAGTSGPHGRRGVGLVVDPGRLGEEWILRVTTQPGWRLAFACTTVEEALAEMQRHAPSLLLVDLALADGSALELLREAGRHWPECVAVALSGDAALSLAAMRALQGLPQGTPKPALQAAPLGPGVLSSWSRGL